MGQSLLSEALTVNPSSLEEETQLVKVRGPQQEGLVQDWPSTVRVQPEPGWPGPLEGLNKDLPVPS